MKAEIYKNGGLWERTNFTTAHQLATKLYGTIEKYDSRFNFLISVDKLMITGGVHEFVFGTYVKIIK
tara:strand:- start:962 stop:1162 length:201 start_codon:yes stop_codon:yes gene_type:complete